jgi:hemerythrin
MPIVQWNINFLLGIREIDQHHQHLVQLLNDTYDEFREKAVIDPSLIGKLLDYAGYHFTFEEKLMKQVSYPGFAEHKEEHDSFASRIAEIQKVYKQKESISVELIWFLCNWITHHIRETDAEFGRYVDVHKIQKRMNKAVS